MRIRRSCASTRFRRRAAGPPQQGPTPGAYRRQAAGRGPWTRPLRRSEIASPLGPLEAGQRGRWRTNPEMVQKLSLTDDWQKMDDISSSFV